mmetsp:Transcript_16007/g.48928  ORF Transcript_16007/g.48928 Transcript_16007/m.48928 type:complete len:217 (+) Transcript_16007:1141-1791(+)
MTAISTSSPVTAELASLTATRTIWPSPVGSSHAGLDQSSPEVHEEKATRVGSRAMSTWKTLSRPSIALTRTDTSSVLPSWSSCRPYLLPKSTSLGAAKRLAKSALELVTPADAAHADVAVMVTASSWLSKSLSVPVELTATAAGASLSKVTRELRGSTQSTSVRKRSKTVVSSNSMRSLTVASAFTSPSKVLSRSRPPKVTVMLVSTAGSSVTSML